MTTGMTSAKVAISLPKEVLARARAAVRRGEAASLSAYVCSALEEKTSKADVVEMFDRMLEETGGPLTQSEKSWADEALGVAKRRLGRGAR
jgi:Arc/MetJ-type ribon-helix-helix transcriptional regulator